MHYYCLTLLILYLSATVGNDVTNLKDNLLKILNSNEAANEGNAIPILEGLKKFFADEKQDDYNDNDAAKHKGLVRRNMPLKLTGAESKDEKIKTLLPKLLKNRRLWQRKKAKASSSSSSEVEEMQIFFDDWGEKRLKKKFEALNSTNYRGDVVNMKSARPWGVACGDTNQHDVPWGTCVLTAECDAEYRIYRGDSFCGRTMFVCCALIHTSYDMYQGLDLSFEHEDSLSTDTDDEKRLNSNEIRHIERKKRRQQRKRTKRAQDQLKKKLRDSIRNVITQITKLLQKAYRNGTAQHYLKSQELMEFIRNMKIQYRKDRKSVADAHVFDMMKYDFKMQENLNKIAGVNENFIYNDTFREIVVNGTVNKELLRKLQQSDPLLSFFFKSDSRRMGGGGLEPELEKTPREEDKDEEEPRKKKKDLKILDYDVEYGMLYY